MTRHGYVLTVAGEMDDRLREEFGDVVVDTARGVTQLTVVSTDPSVVHGLLHRVEAFGLELLEVRSLPDAAPP